MRTRPLTVIVIIVALAGSISIGSWSTNRSDAAARQDLQKQDIQDSDDASKRDLMRIKLNFAKVMVEGLSMHNFDLIRTAATDIRNATESAMWLVHDTPEYNKYSDELKVAAEKLIAAAYDKNIEACTLRFFEVTMNCIDCHDYLRQNSL